MRTITWPKQLCRVAIALGFLTISACRPPSASVPSSPSPPAKTSSQSLPPTEEPVAVIPTPSTETTDSSPQDPALPSIQENKVDQSTPPLPTLPTTPIASVPGSEFPKTNASQSISTELSNFPNPKQPGTSQPIKDVLTKGAFESGEHPTEGEITIVDDEGTAVIEFGQDFQTANGPDLVLVLHRSPHPLDDSQPPAYALSEGDYVEIAPLKANQGKQHYSIPAAIILDNYNSVAIWCRTFNATFGAASLQ